MLTVGMAALILISGGSVIAAFMWPVVSSYAAVVFAVNLVGAVGDIQIAQAMLKVGKSQERLFSAEKDGMAVYAR